MQARDTQESVNRGPVKYPPTQVSYKVTVVQHKGKDSVVREVTTLDKTTELVRETITKYV